MDDVINNREVDTEIGKTSDPKTVSPLPDDTDTKVFTCDFCPKVIFATEAAFDRHIALRHQAMMDEVSALLAKGRAHLQSMHRDNEPRRDMAIAIGHKTFDVARLRDAGRNMLNVATAARQQLQVIVSRWRPTAVVFVFGSSTVMGSWDGRSDIDFAVVDPEAHLARAWPPDERAAVRTLTDLLHSAGFKTSALECVESARVPVVKHTTLTDQEVASKVLQEGDGEAARSVRIEFLGPITHVGREALEQKMTGAIQIKWGTYKDHDCASLLFETTTQAVGATLALSIVFMGSSSAPALVRPLLRADNAPELHRIDFDLCLRYYGVRNSVYLHRYHCEFPNSVYLRSGAVVLKEWSKLWGVNNSYMGFLTSYAINIMWIYFLVQRAVVPYVSPASVSDNPADAPRDPTYVPLAPPTPHSQDVAQRMGELLHDFFYFYAFEFDWDNNVISLNRPEITTKKLLGWEIDNEIKLARSSKNVRYVMCIEDPYEMKLNLGRHLGVCKSRKVRAEFVRAALSLRDDDANDSVAFHGREATVASRFSVRDPEPIDVGKLSQVAAATFEGQRLVTSDLLRAAFLSKEPDAFSTVSAHWRWRTLVRRLGYKQLADRVEKRSRQAGAGLKPCAIQAITPTVEPLPRAMPPTPMNIVKTCCVIRGASSGHGWAATNVWRNLHKFVRF